MKKVRVKNEVGYVSLIGIINTNHPVDYGNYFSLGGFHVINMWYENFKKLNLDKEFIDAVQFGDRHIVIIDDDVPDDYLNNSPCFTGGGGMSKEYTIDVLYYMYPGFNKLKCMCCDSANHVSVSVVMSVSSSGGISLEKGTCMICDRKVYKNNNKEVSEENWNKLYDIVRSIPYDGAFLAPYVITQSVDPGLALDETKSRFYKKEINTNLYGKFELKGNTPELNKPEEVIPETRYTKKHKVGMIRVSDLK